MFYVSHFDCITRGEILGRQITASQNVLQLNRFKINSQEIASMNKWLKLDNFFFGIPGNSLDYEVWGVKLCAILDK